MNHTSHWWIQIEIKDRVFSKCWQFWDHRPKDFMIDIDNIELHVPAKYRSEMLRWLKERKKAA